MNTAAEDRIVRRSVRRHSSGIGWVVVAHYASGHEDTLDRYATREQARDASHGVDRPTR